MRMKTWFFVRLFVFPAVFFFLGVAMCLPLGIFWGLVVIFRSCHDLQPLSCLSSPAEPLTQYLLLSLWLQMVLLHMTCVIQLASDGRGVPQIKSEQNLLDSKSKCQGSSSALRPPAAWMGTSEPLSVTRGGGGGASLSLPVRAWIQAHGW